MIVAPIGIMVVSLCDLDHRRGDVDAISAVEVRRQGLRQAAGATAEVQRAASPDRQAASGCARQYRFDFRDAAAEELVAVPSAAAFVRIGEDGPVRVLPAEAFPVTPERTKSHRLRQNVGDGTTRSTVPTAGVVNQTSINMTTTEIAERVAADRRHLLHPLHHPSAVASPKIWVEGKGPFIRD